MPAFPEIKAVSEGDLKAMFQKFDAVDPSSAGMDINEFKQFMKEGLKVSASDAEIEAAFKEANADDSAGGMGEDLCIDEFMKWVKESG